MTLFLMETKQSFLPRDEHPAFRTFASGIEAKGIQAYSTPDSPEMLRLAAPDMMHIILSTASSILMIRDDVFVTFVELFNDIPNPVLD